MRFFGIDAVGSANSLKEIVILHRLVQIHDLQDGRIKISEELLGHNKKFQQIKGIAETVQ